LSRSSGTSRQTVLIEQSGIFAVIDRIDGQSGRGEWRNRARAADTGNMRIESVMGFDFDMFAKVELSNDSSALDEC
jgi:hypothetical protein